MIQLWSIVVVLGAVGSLGALRSSKSKSNSLGSGPIVNTTYGPVQGLSQDGYDVWHSIPFAAPPVKDLRFRPPQPPTPWTEVKDASEWSEPCPQFDILGKVYLGSEDCLYLDVYRPNNGQPDKKLPVMLWIYGGGLTVGDDSEFAWYDGANMVKNNDVIVVGMNYRLASLGFLALEELKAESNTTGAYGALDQRLAMQWVQANIEAFGGDKTRVTLFGESAGAFSTCWHLAAPGSKGLFSSAILESGTCDSPQFFRDYHYGVEVSNNYASLIGCNGTGSALLECLRGLDVPTMLTKMPVDDQTNTSNPRWPSLSPLMPWAFVLDGSEGNLGNSPLENFKKGVSANVPVIFNTNKDEFSIFVPELPSVVPGTSFPPKEDDIIKCLQHIWFMYDSTVATQIAQETLQQYPVGNFKDTWAQATAMITDYFFTCASRRAAVQLQQHGVPVYLSHFEYAFSFYDGLVYDILGDYHTAELTFVWQDSPLDVFPLNDKDMKVSTAMQQYWTALARVGSPTDPLAPIPKWPAYNSSNTMYMVFDDPVRLEPGIHQAQCDWWDSAVAKLEASK